MEPDSMLKDRIARDVAREIFLTDEPDAEQVERARRSVTFSVRLVNETLRQTGGEIARRSAAMVESMRSSNFRRS